MGMDVYGKKPKNKDGEYFRANVWYWHPLWQYCEIKHPTLANEDKVPYGHANCGSGLKSIDATNLGKFILKDIETGKAQEYIDQRNEHLSSLPLEDCKYCETTGVRQWEDGEKICNACNGTGKTESFEKHYSLDLDILKEFADFLISSGGISIW